MNLNIAPPSLPLPASCVPNKPGTRMITNPSSCALPRGLDALRTVADAGLVGDPGVPPEPSYAARASCGRYLASSRNKFLRIRVSKRLRRAHASTQVSQTRMDARDAYAEPRSFRLTGDPIPILPNKMIRLGLQPASMFPQ